MRDDDTPDIRNPYGFRHVPDPFEPPPPEPMPEYDPGQSPPIPAPYSLPDTFNGEIEIESGIVPLGHDQGVFYYLSRATGQVHPLSPSEHTAMNLRMLASEETFWAQSKFAGKKSIRWDEAAASLMSMQTRIGIFNPARIRGRGAWIEADGRTVLNIGNQLVVDGAPIGTMKLLGDTPSVYVAGLPLAVQLSYHALPTEHATRFLHLCRSLPWANAEASGTILAGWLIAALICGAMPWRPHIWLSSEAAGGKSFILDHIIRPVLGRLCLAIQSKSTEAGIRQTLGRDALAVVFDEAETQNDRDRERFQQILDLARQASTEAGAEIIKGSANGNAKAFHIRSMFCFSSINVPLAQAADESRILVMNLRPNPDHRERAAEFRILQQIMSDTLTDGFSDMLLTRVMSLIPQIRANTLAFAQAIARTGSSVRAGVTLGACLAGAYALENDNEIEPSAADAYVAANPWITEITKSQNEQPEFERATHTLMAHKLRMNNRHGTAEDVPIGELVHIMNGNSQMDDPITTHEASTALNRVGLRVRRVGQLFIANNSTAAEAAFKGTPWAGTSWRKTLARSPNATTQGTQRFGVVVTKGVEITTKSE